MLKPRAERQVHRVAYVATAMVTFLAFASIILPAGHGAIPIGVLMLTSVIWLSQFELTLFCSGMLLGWSGFICVVLLPWCLGLRRGVRCAGIGLLLLGAGWACLFLDIELRYRRVSGSVPFLALLGLWFAVYGIGQVRAAKRVGESAISVSRFKA